MLSRRKLTDNFVQICQSFRALSVHFSICHDKKIYFQVLGSKYFNFMFSTILERKVTDFIPTIGDFHPVGPCKKAVLACLATDVKYLFTFTFTFTSPCFVLCSPLRVDRTKIADQFSDMVENLFGPGMLRSRPKLLNG